MNQATAPPTAVPGPVPLSEEVVTPVEMVDLFDVERVTIDQWAFGRRANTGEHPFPAVEDDTVGSFRVWRLDRLKAWAELTHRAFHEDVWRQKKAAGAYSNRRTTKP